MFDKLQQIKKAKQLYDQAKMLEKAAAAEIETVEEGGIKVVASGDQKIQKIVVDGEELKDITKVVNKALEDKQVKKYIEGKNLELEKDKKIVQKWRTTEFPDDAPDSDLEIP